MTSMQLQYPLLSKIAVDILVVPVSSAPVERVFSTAGEASIRRRNRLTDANLETGHDKKGQALLLKVSNVCV